MDDIVYMYTSVTNTLANTETDTFTKNRAADPPPPPERAQALGAGRLAAILVQVAVKGIRKSVRNCVRERCS